MVRPTGDPYARFAPYYDLFYQDLVNYRGDVAFLERVFQRFSDRRVERVLDLGCGTGNHAILLVRRRYRVTGLDASQAQLAIARRKARGLRGALRFVRGDMRSFAMPEPHDAAVCMFGAIGYLLRTADVLTCLASLRRCLRPGGIFVFEFWRTGGVLPGHTSWLHKAGRGKEILRLSEDHFHRRTSTLEIVFRHLVFRGRRIADRFDEVHRIRTYSIDEMRRLLRRGGFHPLANYAATNERKGFFPVQSDTFRVMAVARLRGPSAPLSLK